MKSVELKWLRNGFLGETGVTWGVPWKKGEQKPETVFEVRDGTGAARPVQTWPLAYWPDGSLKWSAHAAVLETGKAYRLAEGSTGEAPVVRAEKHGKTLEITNGGMVCRMTEGGERILDSLTFGGRTVCSGARLVALKEQRRETPDGCETVVREYEGRADSVRLLQNGPVRCAVEIRGKHRRAGEEGWLPYVLRLYFYAGDPRVHLVHTFLYDGDPEQDFLKGIGLEFQAPLTGEAYNRHAGFGGDTGLFYEPAQLLQSWHPRIPRELYRAQLRGETVGLEGEETTAVREAAKDIPVWSDYRLVQDSVSHFRVEKRTGEGCCYVHAADGGRSPGLAFVGGTDGGIGVGLRDFWQKHPRSLEIRGAAGETASVRAWLYSPEAEAMDLRHYDTRSYVQTYYEGAEEVRSTPRGIANTNELDLWCLGPGPDREALGRCARFLREPPALVCTPERYHGAGAFGVWSLPDRSSARKARLEDQLDRLAGFYREEIDRRGWYGFWDYGDVMHTYDGERHCWKYDMGGYAWDNTELMSDLTLWYLFLRTGRADLFTMASAMTRHSSEVDSYHAGQYKGLGSRHNVLHWGDGCKEARVAMAAHSRFLYYLTADERLGEVMSEMADADFSTVGLDPMRAYYPKDEFPTHARTGPDWASFVSNWMTMWERFGDETYHKKILTGIDCLKKMPFRMISGPDFGYDPATGKLMFFTERPGEHLMISQGEPEVWMELSAMLGDPEWDDMLAEYGRFYMLTPEEKITETGLPVKEKGWSFPIFACSMAAFAAKHSGDAKLAAKVWGIVENDAAMNFREEKVPDRDYLRPVTEIPDLSTNTASQWAINTIQCLELIGDALE
jgi:hypothetical protein